MKTYLHLMIMTLLPFFFTACGGNGGVESVDTASFERAIKGAEVQLLDVRTPEEFAEGHLEGARLLNIKESDFKSKATLALKKDKPVYVYCRSGKRSLAAAQVLADEGYKVINLEGGILAWQEAGHPVTTE